MAIYHLHIDSYRRSRGRSAIGGVAYRRGLKASCPVSGKRFNFRAKDEVAFSEFIPAQNDRTDYTKLENLLQLYEAIERAEKHPRATLGREIEAALPHELDLPQQVELVRAFVAEVRQRFGAERSFFDFSIHDKPNNKHAHICMSEREQAAPFVFEKTKRRDWDGEEFVITCREIWQIQTNSALEKAGISQRVDCRSHADRRLKVLPSFHEGKAAYFNSEVKTMNEAISKANQEIQAVEKTRTERKARVGQILKPSPQPEQIPYGVECAESVSAKPYTAILVEQRYGQIFAFSGALSFVNLRDPRKAVLLFKDKSKILDYGNRVESVGSTPEESARRIVALAMAKGWGSVSFSGDEAFLRAAFFLAIENNLVIVPKDAAQQKILDEVLAESPATAMAQAKAVAYSAPIAAPLSLSDLGAKLGKRDDPRAPARKRGLGL